MSIRDRGGHPEPRAIARRGELALPKSQFLLPCCEDKAEPVVVEMLTAGKEEGQPGVGLDEVKRELLQRLDAHHESLTLELRDLKKELLSKLREELLSQPGDGLLWAAAGVNGGDVSPSPSPSPSPSRKLHVSTPISQSEEKAEVKTNNASLKSEHIFASQPNLHAFMMAKNWDSLDDLSEVLHREASMETPAMMCKKYREPLLRLIETEAFDLMVGVMIMANAIVMAVGLEYEGMITATEWVGLKSDSGSWPGAGTVFLGLEHFFTIFFVIELILRLAAIGPGYLRIPMNWMDFGIVAVSVVELYVLGALDLEIGNLSFIRLIRVLKLMRVLRAVRVLKFFYQLRVLVSAVTSSLGALGWSICFLGVIQLIAAIFMTQSLQVYLRDESADPADQAEVYTYFGTFVRSFLTMFEITLAPGSWGRCGRTVIYKVGWYYMFFFTGYMSVVSFACIRVISAIFLKETLTAAAHDSEAVMADLNRDPRYVNNLKKVFDDMDTSGKGFVTLKELKVLCDDPRCHEWLATIGISAHEMRGAFILMDDGDDDIYFAEFLAGVMRLRHKNIDLATLLYENKKILKRVLLVKDEVIKAMHVLTNE